MFNNLRNCCTESFKDWLIITVYNIEIRSIENQIENSKIRRNNINLEQQRIPGDIETRFNGFVSCFTRKTAPNEFQTWICIDDDDEYLRQSH